MTTVTDGIADFWGDNGTQIGNIVLTLILFVALLHAFSYATLYCITLFHIAVYGEKNSQDSKATQYIARAFMTFYLIYNGIVYALLLKTIDWGNLFTKHPYKGSIFDTPGTDIFRFEPLILVLITWFKIFCASDAWRREPTEANVIELLENLDADRLPEITIIMPIYNEPIETLMDAINSVTKQAYPLHRIRLVMAFDDDRVSQLYRAVIYCLTSGNPDPDWSRLSSSEGLDELGVSDNSEDYPFIGDVMYRGLRITPCRFVHGGKRHAQMHAFRYLDDQFKGKKVKPLLLFIDSDIDLDEFALANFVYDFNRHKGIQREALTGLITCKTAKTYSFWKGLQDTEYIESQLLQRNTEDYLGSVSCLPGALTMVRFEALKRVAGIYFGQMEAQGTFDFNRTHLGEDRYLTHLLMESRPEKYRIGFCGAARCKTHACEDFRTLLKQRRRWYLGTVTNEIYMLTSPALWKQFPGLNAMIGLTALKNGPLFIYAFFLEALRSGPIEFDAQTALSIGLAALIFIPIWLFVSAYAIKINRIKVAFYYPLIVICLPILSALFQVYGMYTFKVRSWGGPRAADEDDDEVVPEKSGVDADVDADAEAENDVEAQHSADGSIVDGKQNE